MLFFIIGPTIGWFACVIGAAKELFWLGPLTVVILLLSSTVIRGKMFLSRMASLCLISVVLGIFIDSLLIGFGIYVPKRWFIPAPFATLWLLGLWANFSITIDTSLQWLQSHLISAAILGAVFGPSAYFAGQRLGALTISRSPVAAISILAMTWAFVAVVLSAIARSLPSPVGRSE
jgi:hypothetical protein